MLWMRVTRRVCGGVAAAVLAAHAAAQPAVRPVVVSGQAAPGIPNRNIATVLAPVTGTTGQIWFVANLAENPVGSPGPTTVLYRADAGGVPQPVFTNGPVPGFIDRTWATWSNLAPGAHGEIAFLSTVARTDIGGSYQGLFRAELGGSVLELVAATDVDVAPGRTSPFTGFESIACAPGLRMVVKGFVGSIGHNTGIWGGSPLTNVLFEGDQVTGLPAGVVWGDTAGPGSPSIQPSAVPLVNTLGEITFKTSLAGAVTTSNNEVIVAGSPLVPVRVVREGDPVVAAGAPAGATWLMFGPPALNDRGEIAFLGVFTGSGITPANDEGLFVGTPGNLRLVLREDDPAPGVQGFRLHERDSTLNVWTFRNISISNQGKVAFITGLASAAGISNSNDSLAYVGQEGNWQLIGRQGDAAPTGTAGDLYGDFTDIGLTPAAPAGDVAFVNVLNGVNRALFAGPLGMHGLLARRNGPITVAPGDVRTILTSFNDFQFSLATGGSDGRVRSFSNAGNLAYRARYTGGEGIFEATLRPVVQPPGDRDGDGLSDAWESGPIDLNEDGTPDLDLAALGADPDHKDLFVEIDVQSEVGSMLTAVDLVVLAFDEAPVMNPDGVPGITLHAMFSDHFSEISPWLVFGPSDFPVGYPAARNQYFGDPADRTSPNALWRLEARRRAVRYVLVIAEALPQNYYGIAETPGDDCCLVLGHPDLRADVDRAATFMHELGHLLGLRHGGADHVNVKPNYPSIMNYALSKRHAFSDGFWRLDYCRQTLPPIDELAFNETAGVGTATGLYTHFRMPIGIDGPTPGTRDTGYVRLDGSPADVSRVGGPWSPDGMFETSVRQDFNYLGAGSAIAETDVSSLGDTMLSQNDWAYVNLRIGVTGAFALSRVSPPAHAEPGPAATAWIEANLPRPPGSCAADFNRSGGAPSVQDIFDFLAAFFGSSAWADFNRSGGPPTVQDIFDFLAAYFTPC